MKTYQKHTREQRFESLANHSLIVPLLSVALQNARMVIPESKGENEREKRGKDEDIGRDKEREDSYKTKK